MTEGHVLYADQDHVHVLRYIGDIRHPLAPAVGAFVDDLVARMNGDHLVVDLSETEAIDSTNLGEIARIAELLHTRGGRRAAIISTRPPISEVLYSMAFNEVFDVCTEPVAAAEARPIPSVEASPEASLEIILDAHRRLMRLSENNRKQFCEVVDLIEQQCRSSSPSPSPDRPGRPRA
jgi:anti-anti-sigma factor